MDLTNEDVADVLALLDSLPYDELDLQTTRFRLILRRTPGGWTRSAESRSAPDVLAPEASDGVRGTQAPSIGAGGTHAPMSGDGAGADGTGGDVGGGGAGLVAVRAPLPGTFYRAPRPGAAPFVQVGSHVGAEDVVGIVETMKLMNSVTAGVAGTVAEICLGNAEFAANGATLLRIRAD
jgi:acetyl-CoA carboxylase biotin carboxyl carrier protein